MWFTERISIEAVLMLAGVALVSATYLVVHVKIERVGERVGGCSDGRTGAREKGAEDKRPGRRHWGRNREVSRQSM